MNLLIIDEKDGRGYWRIKYSSWSNADKDNEKSNDSLLGVWIYRACFYSNHMVLFIKEEFLVIA
jgi:hypothetical protein